MPADKIPGLRELGHGHPVDKDGGCAEGADKEQAVCGRERQPSPDQRYKKDTKKCSDPRPGNLAHRLSGGTGAGGLHPLKVVFNITH